MNNNFLSPGGAKSFAFLHCCNLNNISLLHFLVIDEALSLGITSDKDTVYSKLGGDVALIYNVQIDDGTAERVELTISTASIGSTQYSQILKVTFDKNGNEAVVYRDVFKGRINAYFEDNKLICRLSGLVQDDFNRNFQCAASDSSDPFKNPEKFIKLKEAGMTQLPFPSRQICRKKRRGGVYFSLYIELYICILNASSTKTHSSRLTF